MRKIITFATAGLFALSLQGSALAQTQEKAPEIMPRALESTAPVAPAPVDVAPEKIEQKSQKKTSLKKKNKKSNQKRAKKKKVKKAKKKAV